MYAVVQTGGKQYKVEVGRTIDVEHIAAEVGDTVELSPVLMVSGDDGFHLGNPAVSGAKVTADVVQHGRGKKLIVFRYKPKTRYRKKTGHRQNFTRLAIKSITVE
jgi:large subunit ribosomal protein L21